MSHKHITPIQRNELSVLIQAQVKQKDIAKILSKDRSTIFRERKRNSKEDGKYHARIAKRQTKERRIRANQRFRKIENNLPLKKKIVVMLQKYWSPEEISGKLSNKIGKDSIYNFIYDKRPDLVKYLRCAKGKFRRRRGTRLRIKQRKEMENKRNIGNRPLIVEARKRLGDWEGDTVVSTGNKGSVLLTINERKSGYVLISKIKGRKSELVLGETKRRFERIPRDKKKTVTYDNGSEFAEYEMIEKETGMNVFFANPYHSWERGSNENTNGLIRQFFPKKTNFDNVSKKEIKKVERLLNNRPRKRLNYLTPKEVFLNS
jgi:IS30 family transposase